MPDRAERLTYTIELTPEQRDWWREWARPQTLSKVLRELVDDASGFAIGEMKPPPAVSMGDEQDRRCCERTLLLLDKTTCVVCGRTVSPTDSA